MFLGYESKFLKSVSVLFLLGNAACVSPAISRPDKAKQELASKNYDRAITEYEEHIQARLVNPNRPESENPYFYLLLIGDVELQRGNIEKALEKYQEADLKKVDAPLVTNRYLEIARAYEDKKDYEKALRFLRDHVQRDPLVINGILDRLARRKR